MNKKAGEGINFQLVLIILAAATLLGLVAVFVFPYISTATNFLDIFGFDFEGYETTSGTIDEERIDEGTLIRIDALDDPLYVLEFDDELITDNSFANWGIDFEPLSYDQDSGLTTLLKLEKGEEWQLKGFATQADEEAFENKYYTEFVAHAESTGEEILTNLGFSELRENLWNSIFHPFEQSSVAFEKYKAQGEYLSTFLEKYNEEVLLFNDKPLLSILDSSYARGKVSLTIGNEEGYALIKTPTQHNFQWFEDRNGDEKYQEGEGLETTAVAFKILANYEPKSSLYLVRHGMVYIKKQGYEKGWNLEFDKDEIDVKYKAASSDITTVWDTEEKRILIANTDLATLLDSQYIRGSLRYNGKTYIHTPSEHDFRWFEDTNNDGVYQSGEEIETGKLSQIILASLWEEAT